MHEDAAATPVVVAPCRSHDSAAASPWLLIANPVAGRGGPQSRAWLRLERALHEAGVPFETEWTRERGDGAGIAAAAARRGQHRFLVAGGDGSLHDVVNGVLRERSYAAPGHALPAPIVVPLPLGTGNDWARSLALPDDPRALARFIRAGVAEPHDVGRIDLLTAADAVHASHWFINVAGAGFDAHVIERMPARTPSRVAYLVGALRELSRYRAPQFQLALHSSDPLVTAHVHGRRLVVFIANGRYCGGGMHVAPQARLDDGRFDVVTIDALGLRQALPKLARLYTGTLTTDRAVEHRLATSVRVDAEPAAGIEADGQFVGQTPARFTIVRGALQTLRGPGRTR